MHLVKCLVLVAVFLVFDVSSCKIADDEDGLSSKNGMLEMQNAIKQQNMRILNLEKSLSLAENRISRLFSEQIHSEQQRSQLKLRLSNIQSDLKKCKRIGQSRRSHGVFPGNACRFSKVSKEKERKERRSLSKVRKGRLLEPLLTPTPTTTMSEVAFFAYMSQPLTKPGGQHILKFDVVKINVGNAYHQYTGVFNPPYSGIYVMAWSLRIRTGTSISTELIVNNDVYSSLLSYVHDGDDEHNSAIIVIHANKGDDVYIRIKIDNYRGDIYSDANGRSTFAGWKIY
ncbi:C1QL [Mytilus edulis]|uniref:C1QL n=1 Tax=Mytilus edulis TaxID=6550 RepID=A0A8S3TPK6_MYTED|nr:C1QL [Mytilus edulis]